MEKMTRKIIAILTVAAMLFALPFIATADNQVDYPEQELEVAVPAPAELPPAEEPVAQAPAEEFPVEVPTGDYPVEEVLEDEYSTEEYPTEELSEDENLEEATSAVSALGEVIPFDSALENVIDELLDIRDRVNAVLDDIRTGDPGRFPNADWNGLDDLLYAWDYLWYRVEWLDGQMVVVADGLYEFLEFLLLNWAGIANQQEILMFLQELAGDLEESVEGWLGELGFECEHCGSVFPNPDCTFCGPPPPPPPEPTPVDRDALRSAIGAAGGRVQANYTPETWNAFIAALEAARAVYANPNATQAQIDAALAVLLAAKYGLEEVQPSGQRRPSTTVVAAVIAPQTGDVTSTQAPLVKLMISLFAISGITLVKFRMRKQ